MRASESRQLKKNFPQNGDPSVGDRLIAMLVLGRILHRHYELHEKVQYHYLALQTLLLRTSGLTTTLILRKNWVSNFTFHTAL